MPYIDLLITKQYFQNAYLSKASLCFWKCHLKEAAYAQPQLRMINRPGLVAAAALGGRTAKPRRTSRLATATEEGGLPRRVALGALGSCATP